VAFTHHLWTLSAGKHGSDPRPFRTEEAEPLFTVLCTIRRIRMESRIPARFGDSFFDALRSGDVSAPQVRAATPGQFGHRVSVNMLC
jgi:hypothetical protein